MCELGFTVTDIKEILGGLGWLIFMLALMYFMFRD